MKNFLLSLCLLFSLVASAQESPVTFNELPKQAKDFLNEHFSEMFNHGMKEFEAKKVLYDVYLEDKTEIEFSEVGRWKIVDGKGKKIPNKLLQFKIADYLKAAYPNSYPTRLERTDMYYFVRLNSNIDLQFDAQGNFMKIK